jgi:hypothetical protein
MFGLMSGDELLGAIPVVAIGAFCTGLKPVETLG